MEGWGLHIILFLILEDLAKGGPIVDFVFRRLHAVPVAWRSQRLRQRWGKGLSRVPAKAFLQAWVSRKRARGFFDGAGQFRWSKAATNSLVVR